MTSERPNRVLLASFLGTTLVVLGVIALLVHVANTDRDDRVRRRAQFDRLQRGAREHPTTLDPLRGYWVWAREIEGATVRRRITVADMVATVGPGGWPGCPDDIVCTRYGIHGIIIGTGDRVHIVHHVVTSSDFQFEGTIRMQEPGVAVVEVGHHFSCAHPWLRNNDPTTFYTRAMRRGEELWLSVADFTDKDVSFGTDLPPQSQRWVVYRRVTRELFYRRYMLRRCQPTADVPTCDPDCFSDQLAE